MYIKCPDRYTQNYKTISYKTTKLQKYYYKLQNYKTIYFRDEFLKFKWEL